MSANVALRPLTPTDGPALQALFDASPDGGEVQFTSKFIIDPYRALLGGHEHTESVVAEVEGELSGIGLVTFGQCVLEDQQRPYALLSALKVHPKYRRQGIAARLAQWRIARAREQFGDEVVLIAFIQRGNIGSQRNALKWAQTLGGRFMSGPLGIRAKPPTSQPGLTVADLSDDQLGAFSEGLNAFYAGGNFFIPETAERLRAWRNASPFETPYRHVLGALDDRGQVVAGLTIADSFRLRTMVTPGLPLSIRLANAILKLLPADGVIRDAALTRLWYGPGRLPAARHLLDTVRWQWREQANAFLTAFDPRGPVAPVIDRRPWSPFTEIMYAIHAPVAVTERRVLFPMM